jgi:kynurenine formamidase
MLSVAKHLAREQDAPESASLIIEAVEIVDLSLPVTAPPFRDPASGYGDPQSTRTAWLRIGQVVDSWTSPFSVSLLQLGAHAGSHIDAPSHFDPDGATVSDLPLAALTGRAVVLDLRGDVDVLEVARRLHDDGSRDGVTPLILTPPAGLLEAVVDELIAWQRPLLAFAGPVDSGAGYSATRRLLAADRWLAVDLDAGAAGRVRDGDLLVVAPLAWPGLEGAPCRVLALRL